jgi:thiamine pyrophosphate-dependent acetolactate synthase large subunit-like protein
VIKHDSIFSGYDRHIPEAIKRYQTSTQKGDYAEVARALGCHSEKVEQVADLRPALERGIQATKAGQAAVVDVITCETRKLSKEWQ